MAKKAIDLDALDNEPLVSGPDIGDRIIDTLGFAKSHGHKAFEIVVGMLANELYECINEGRRLRAESQPAPKNVSTWACARHLGWRLEDVLLTNMEALRQLQTADEARARAAKTKRGRK